MVEREQKRKSQTQRDSEELHEEDVQAKNESAEKLKADLDDLLDEIDEVLEENAEEFVRNYVQKGGQ